MDVAPEPGEMGGKGSPKVGGNSPGNVCDGPCLPAEAGVSSYLTAAGCRSGQKALPKLVCVGTGRRTA